MAEGQMARNAAIREAPQRHVVLDPAGHGPGQSADQVGCVEETCTIGEIG